jgi:predicted DNA-binding transcriptional regulator AlpA
VNVPDTTLHLHHDDAGPVPVEVPSNNPVEVKPPRATAAKGRAGPVEKLAVPADEAGPMCGVSKATWWRMHSGGLCPAPVKMSHRTLWRTEELRRWMDAGAPPRKTWDAMEKARKAGR